jgi:hypothetical protein
MDLKIESHFQGECDDQARSEATSDICRCCAPDFVSSLPQFQLR